MKVCLGQAARNDALANNFILNLLQQRCPRQHHNVLINFWES